MNKLKLTLSILALTVSQITMADYVMKIPLEVSNGGTLPNGSIIFKAPAVAPAPAPAPAVEPVLPPVVDCVELGVSADCDERLGAWGKFADDRGLSKSKNWNNLFWSWNNLTNIPIEPYPATYVVTLNLSANKLTNVDGLSNLTSAEHIILSQNNLKNVEGLSNITSAGVIDLLYNNLTNLNGLANIAISYEIYIDSSYSGPKLKANSRFCSLTPMDRFSGASKSKVCETP